MWPWAFSSIYLEMPLKINVHRTSSFTKSQICILKVVGMQRQYAKGMHIKIG